MSLQAGESLHTFVRAVAPMPSVSSGLRAIVRLVCWPPHCHMAVVSGCCRGKLPSEFCFNTNLTWERCCPSTNNDDVGERAMYGADVANGEDTPIRGQASWELDDACAASWIDPRVSAEDIARHVATNRPGRRCENDQWVYWDGEAVRLIEGVTAGFAVLDVSMCLWGSVACFNLMDIRSNQVAVQGRSWRPPPPVTAVFVKKDDGAERFPLLFIPIVRMRRRKRLRYVDAAVAGAPRLRPQSPLQFEASQQDPQSDAAPLGIGIGPWQANPNVSNRMLPIGGELPPRVEEREAHLDLGRPSLYMLTLDSVSRSLLRVAMPRTFEFLTREAAAPARRGVPVPESKATPGIPSSHEVLEFSRYHTLYFGGTLSQMFPFFFGGLLVSCAHSVVEMAWNGLYHVYNLTGALRKCAAFPGGGALGELHRAGYRLGVSFTDVGFGAIVRDAVRWDHVLPYIVDGLQRLKQEGGDIDFLCMGPRRLHELVLDWNLDVLDLYRGIEPTFIYSHLLAAHVEKELVSGLDLAVRDHIRMTLERNPDLVVVVTADHGCVSVACDQKAPMLHILVPKSLLRRRPHVAAALHVNQHKVVSALDWFATLRHLAGSSTVNDWGGFRALRAQGVRQLLASPTKVHQEALIVNIDDSRFAPRSLFATMPRNRSCASAGIPRRHCAVRFEGSERDLAFCTHYAALSEVTRTRLSTAEAAKAREPMDVERSLVCHVASETMGRLVVRHINEKNQRGSECRRKCRSLTFSQLESIEVSGGVERHYRLRFAVREGDPPRVFDAVVFMRPQGMVFEMSIAHLAQVTRYYKYERCTPPGARAETCVCE